ncbi:hypothetical protein FRB95_008536 [Tulasnella sp. JGI-2019a]|nr:hypothetical protein FRB95_008536 [Tulasnella sp. JGI-2019a]
MSGFKSIASLPSSILKRVPLEKKKLSRYSWIFDVLTIKGSVGAHLFIVPRIIGPVLTVTLFALIVATGSEIYGKQLAMNNSVVPLLSVVVGLLLVFR